MPPHRIPGLLSLALASALLLPRATMAQVLPVTPGARVRMSVPGYDITGRTGTLVRVTPDSLTIDFRGSAPPVTVPLDAVSHLDMSTGKRRQAGFWRGAGIGFLVTGAIVGGTWLSSRDSCTGDCTLGYAIYGGSGIVLGTILGGVIGLTRAPDRWEAVPLRGGK